MSVSDFWETRYLPYCEREYKGVGMKPSTVRGFKQIWRQHLKAHFADLTLQRYAPDLARRFLGSIKTTQGKNTLKHVRALGSALFNEAIERGLRKEANPWHVKLPKDCKDTEQTQHYTLEEAENIVSALVEHPDAQLVITLACFLGLRPGEVAALRWEDFDADSVHIRRSVVRGHVGTPKTAESIATLPLIDQVRVPLELWRQKSGDPKEGWIFGSRNDTPTDLHNVINRVIIPHVNGSGRCIPCDKVPKKSGVVWKGLYAGRRGAATAIIGLTNGNYAAAQELLRHKSMNTTLQFYKKQTKSALADGLKIMQKALSAGAGEEGT
jgi:integrase